MDVEKACGSEHKSIDWPGSNANAAVDISCPIAGLANHSETMSHIFYCVSAKSQIIHKI